MLEASVLMSNVLIVLAEKSPSCIICCTPSILSFPFSEQRAVRNIVKSCDYLYLNKEIYFAKPLKVSEPGAGGK